MRHRALAAVALLVALLPACAQFDGVRETRGVLRRAGYDVDEVGVTTVSGTIELRVSWRPAARTAAERTRERQALAKAVWESAEGRFDRLVLVAFRPRVPGAEDSEGVLLTRAELEAAHGARDPVLDTDAYASGVGAGTIALIVGGVVLLLGTVFLFLRSAARHRRAAQAWDDPNATPAP